MLFPRYYIIKRSFTKQNNTLNQYNSKYNQIRKHSKPVSIIIKQTNKYQV
jgi:hypothetical protein